eukprot:TRINITY_DN1311_c0_g1_i20.p1 TRINITY_DN1311_c0_g1~~TRINITY_DN1311_c0_g1_i20.p1  ORF type:complete len:402 (+),score=64.76 TRINITY_DN1311_c0_g1_i20:121-1326(+)
MSVDYASIPKPQPDAVFGMKDRFMKDPSPLRVNLVIGAYRDENGKPWKLPCVKAAEKILYEANLNHEYLDIIGDPQFRKVSQQLLFGEWLSQHGNRVVSIQTLSGTGSLRICCDFIKKFLPGRTIYLPHPTWPNHMSICQDAGLEYKPYAYYNEFTRGLDFNKLIENLLEIPDGSVILLHAVAFLHAVAHNPTGVDPSPEQWRSIADVITQKSHVTLFDLAYQGFASGDLEKDAYAVRLWNQLGLSFFVAQSFAKNFGLYGDRVGCVHLVLPPEPPVDVESIYGQFSRIIRAQYSNPPAHGSNLVKTILQNPLLFEQWKVDLNVMSSRLHDVRQKLYGKLIELKTPGEWHHIVDQIGMFTYTGLTCMSEFIIIVVYSFYLFWWILNSFHEYPSDPSLQQIK